MTTRDQALDVLMSSTPLCFDLCERIADLASKTYWCPRTNQVVRLTTEPEHYIVVYGAHDDELVRVVVDDSDYQLMQRGYKLGLRNAFADAFDKRRWEVIALDADRWVCDGQPMGGPKVSGLCPTPLQPEIPWDTHVKRVVRLTDKARAKHAERIRRLKELREELDGLRVGGPKVSGLCPTPPNPQREDEIQEEIAVLLVKLRRRCP